MLILSKLTLICALAAAAQAQIDPTIPLRVKTPQVQDPMETMRRAQEIRNLQLQNEQIRLQNEATIRARESNARPTPPSLRDSPAEIMAEVTTHGLLNCRAWKSGDEGMRAFYIYGAIETLTSFVADTAKEPDKIKELIENYLPYELNLNEMTAGVSQLCGQPENARLPVFNVLKVLSLKTRSGTPREVEETLSIDRKVSSMVFDSEKIRGGPTAIRCAR
jgi:hypothetical protein